MAKSIVLRRKKQWKIAKIAAVALAAALAVIIVTFCIVRPKAGLPLDKQAKIVEISVINGGSFRLDAAWDGSAKKMTAAANNESFDETVSAVGKMCSFSAMRGMLEGKWFPKTKITAGEYTDDPEYDINESELKAVSAAGGYLIVALYDRATTFELYDEVKPNKGEKKEKRTITYDTAVFAVQEKNTVEEIKVYLFVRDDYEQQQLGQLAEDFHAFAVSIYGIQEKLFLKCKALF